MFNAEQQLITSLFANMFYWSRNTWNNGNTKYMGVPCLQCPMDMWVLHEVFFETRPNLIIETGSALGASALFYAHCLDNMSIPVDEGRIVSIDTQAWRAPITEHERITFLKGMSVNPEIVAQVKAMAKPEDRVMVILDSDHSTENVLAELETYHEMVTVGCYLIVEDTNLGGNPVHNMAEPGPGPMAAVNEFLAKNHMFEVDEWKERYFLTHYPRGWLRRIR